MHEILQHLHDIEMKKIKSDNKNNKSKTKGKNNENKDKISWYIVLTIIQITINV